LSSFLDETTPGAGRLGADASASEILGVVQLSNVYAITGTQYFHQSNFNFKHHHFLLEIIYLLRFVCIDPALFPLRKDYFHQNNIHWEITHCILAKGESSFHFSSIVIFSFIPLLSALYRSGRCPKVMYPTTPPLCGNLGVLKRRQAGAHLDRVLATCASFRFAIQTLRSHGLRPGEPHMVTSATAVSSIMYASPAWWGFTNASERSRLNRLIAALKRAGFLPTDFPTFDELARQADAGLFRAICSNPDHVLRHYFTLPPKDSRNFVSRSLYGALL